MSLKAVYSKNSNRTRTLMQISKIRQPLFDQLINEEADIVICASGYETRSSHLAEYFGKLKARRIVLGFKEHRDGGSRLNNDQIYEKMNFETRELDRKSTRLNSSHHSISYA